MRKLATNLAEFIALEMRRLRDCAECYSNRQKYPRDWFTMVCEEPHIIVWIKINDAYWPAKLMSVNWTLNGSKTQVRLFASKTEMLWTECFLYSEEYPGNMNTRSACITAAMEVIII